jgi:hypothetical protein
MSTVTNRHPAISFFNSRRLLSIAILLYTASLSAQVVFTAVPDSNNIAIGDYLGVRLTAKFSGSKTLTWPEIKDTLGRLEIVEHGKFDTVKAGAETLISQHLQVSAYDSGTYTIPAQKLLYSDNGITDSAFSGPVEVYVNTLAVDTAKPVRPIKAPLDIALRLRDILPYILMGLLAIALIVLGIWLYRKYKKKPEEKQARPKPKEPAHIWAEKELRTLEADKLWQKDEIKAYYTRLTDILRLYIEYRYDLQAMESTTDEIREMIAHKGFPADAQQKLIEILKLSDLVKFAKMTPMYDEHQKCMVYAFDIVSQTKLVETAANTPVSKKKKKK